jgi:hypothetical protein
MTNNGNRDWVEEQFGQHGIHYGLRKAGKSRALAEVTIALANR